MGEPAVPATALLHMSIGCLRGHANHMFEACGLVLCTVNPRAMLRPCLCISRSTVKCFVAVAGLCDDQKGKGSEQKAGHGLHDHTAINHTDSFQPENIPLGKGWKRTGKMGDEDLALLQSPYFSTCLMYSVLRVRMY